MGFRNPFHKLGVFGALCLQLLRSRISAVSMASSRGVTLANLSPCSTFAGGLSAAGAHRRREAGAYCQRQGQAPLLALAQRRGKEARKLLRLPAGGKPSKLACTEGVVRPTY